MSEMFSSNDQALPQYSIDSLNSLSGFMDTMFTLQQIKDQHCIPARIVTYNRSTHLATVQPLVDYTVDTADGKKYIERPQYKGIFVVSMGSAGFVFDFPLHEGDPGFLFAVDRSWSAARKENSSSSPEDNAGPQPSDDDSLVSFENGIFIPSCFCSNGTSFVDGIAMRKVDGSGNDVGGIYLDGAGNATIKGMLDIIRGGKRVNINPENMNGDFAAFTSISVPTDETFIDENGYTHIKTRKKSFIADNSNEYGDDIIVKAKGGDGGLKDVNIRTESLMEKMTLVTTKSESNGVVSFSILLAPVEDEKEEDDETIRGGSNYCNFISDEDGGPNIEDTDSNPVPNEISDLEPGNGISWYPCVYDGDDGDSLLTQNI